MYLARMCQYLEKPISSSQQHGSSLAIITLTTIFNVLPVDSENRFHVFKSILKVIRSTSSTSAFEALTPQLKKNVPQWLQAWELDDEDIISLYTTIAEVASSSGNKNMEYEYLLHALESIPPSSASKPESHKIAKQTLTAAFVNPAVTDFTPLTESDTIQALRESDSQLFDFLEIYASGDYAAYLDFTKDTSLSSLGLEAASPALETKIRLLTLASIAASSSNRSVPYTKISEALQVPEDEVEMWVIDTIRAGLVEGKLSQLKKEFLVQRATYRVFGEKHWLEIQGRLMVWRRSLENVLSVVRNERERFEREGPSNAADEVVAKTNGYERRQGGGRRNQQREVDFVGGD